MVSAKSKDLGLRQHVLYLLRGGGAHVSLEKAVRRIPFKLLGVKPQGLPFSLWQLLEHMRIAQWDILEFSRNRKHESPPFPQGYWPRTDAPKDAAQWARSLAAFRSDLKQMQALVADASVDLLSPIPHGDGQTILREGLLIADHNAYHLGQWVLVRRLLGNWPKD